MVDVKKVEALIDVHMEDSGADSMDIITALATEVVRLEEEVEFLRRYGNKDCTAQADEALAIAGWERETDR